MEVIENLTEVKLTHVFSGLGVNEGNTVLKGKPIQDKKLQIS